MFQHEDELKCLNHELTISVEKESIELRKKFLLVDEDYEKRIEKEVIKFNSLKIGHDIIIRSKDEKIKSLKSTLQEYKALSKNHDLLLDNLKNIYTYSNNLKNNYSELKHQFYVGCDL
ncbi:hypothetical protein CANARDRAFT_25862 [[Candida] arabinofermentans NRRL YB-2248]|uniref:Uncharacterized protein n=1 Tax=[Candida] arabinofermentans NRRL YB-2248 TaxID=983967 RepID=A0A1E4SSP2_9ASCO|nr:hypothetical protein CANARDRAFT_25862 [[Candida] arabinofermentans NRRL YB-2248]